MNAAAAKQVHLVDEALAAQLAAESYILVAEREGDGRVLAVVTQSPSATLYTWGSHCAFSKHIAFGPLERAHEKLSRILAPINGLRTNPMAPWFTASYFTVCELVRDVIGEEIGLSVAGKETGPRLKPGMVVCVEGHGLGMLRHFAGENRWTVAFSNGVAALAPAHLIRAARP